MKISDYKGLNVGKKEFSPVSEDEISAELNNLLNSKVSYKTKEGKSVLGDTVNIDYKGLLDDVAFEGGTAEKYDLALGSGSFIPGFEEQLVGYEAGSDVDVHVTFPEQYHAENLAGKDVVFKCHIHEVKEKVTPEFNDEFAKGFGLDSAEALKTELARQMNAKKKNDLDHEYLGRLIKTIIDASEIEVSEELMKERVDEIYSYYEQQIGQYGMTMDSYLAMQSLTVEDFRNQLADQAMASAQGDVLFDEIAKMENITVEDSEVEHDLKMYQDYYQVPDEEFKKFRDEKTNDVKSDILRRKVAVFLVENNN
jgi:trigger factor